MSIVSRPLTTFTKALELLHKHANKGYHKEAIVRSEEFLSVRYSTLCIAFRKFARKYTQVLEKYGWSIRKHIEDGVCLPAMDPFLSRHVSRRSIYTIRVF